MKEHTPTPWNFLSNFQEFQEDSEAAEKAAFDTAMQEKLNEMGGYRVRDMFWDIYQLQKRVSALEAKAKKK